MNAPGDRPWRLACVAGVVAYLALGVALAEPTRVAVAVRPAEAESTDSASAFAGVLLRRMEASNRWSVLGIRDLVERGVAARARRAIAAAEQKASDGVDALVRLDTRAAGALLKDAVEGYRGNAAQLDDPTALARALLYLGAIELLHERRPAGRALLNEALALSRSLEPDVRIFNPPMRKELAALAARLDAALGAITINSDPTGAPAFVDGTYVGTTPVRATELRRGAHLVRVVSDGHAAWGRFVDVIAGADVIATAKLEAGPQRAEVALRLDEAYRAADAAEGVELRVARFGRAADVDQVLLVRVRRTAAADVLAADAALYSVARVKRLARATVDLPGAGKRAALEGPALRLLRDLAAPPLSITALVTTAGDAPAALAAALPATLLEDARALDARLSTAPADVDIFCLNDPKCVVREAASVDAVLVLQIELSGTGERPVLSLSGYDGRTGVRLLSLREPVAAGALAPGQGLFPMVARIIDAWWEAGGQAPAVAPGPEPEPPPPATPAEVAPPAEVPDLTRSVPAAAPTPLISVLAWAGVGVGAAMAGTGVGLAVHGGKVLDDPSSLGGDKERAHTLGLVGVGLIAVGLVVAGAGGGWILWGDAVVAGP
jgi:hypothetical protein